MLSGHGRDGLGAGSGVALQRSQVLVTALSHKQGQDDTGLSEVG
jgi:hypothetical protein